MPRLLPALAPITTVLALGLIAWSAFSTRETVGQNRTADEKSASVQAFFKAQCLKCHDATKHKGDLTLHDISTDIAGGKDLSKWAAIAERLKAGDMPPEGEKQPDPDAIAGVTGWIDGELTAAGKSGALKPGSLRTGNHIPHELLFNPNAQFPLDNPPRLWRISPFIYTEAGRAMNKNLKLSQPFALPAGDGFKDQSGSLGMDTSTLSQLLRNAEAIVDTQLGLTKGSKTVSVFQPLIDEQSPATRLQLEKAVTYQFEFALKRKPTADELKRFVALHETNVKTGGAEAGTRVTLMTVLLLPEAVFRMELGTPVAAGRRLLAPRELAFAIAYALTDRAPDKALLDAADSGRLKTADDVTREINRLFADPKIEKTRTLRFFREYFGYGEAINVFKNDKDFSGHDARSLVDDTDRLIGDVLARDQDVFRELLTTNKSYVAFARADADQKKMLDEQAKYEQGKKANPDKYKNRVAPNDPSKLRSSAYNLNEYPPSMKQPVELPATQRAGILTQPSWLVAMSDNADNHAIRRGKWVRERLLGGTVPDLPIGVDAQLPDAPEKTLRQRMDVTRQVYCWQCHAKMNPLGLAFENFDHFGRWRDTELGKPVDASAVIDRIGDKSLEAPYSDSLEMIRKLAGSDRARQVFIRHAFRYWMGRDENLGDARTLQAADAAYLKSGGSMNALIIALLTSESFLYRTE